MPPTNQSAKFRAGRSLRGVEPSVSLYLRDLGGGGCAPNRRGSGMSGAHGQIRRSQAITIWGPGALIDLPTDAGIVGGLDTAWPNVDKLEPVVEPRLARKIALLTGVPNPPLYAPPAQPTGPGEPDPGIGVYRFPEWFVVAHDSTPQDGPAPGRRLVHRKALDEKRRRFDGQPVVPTRFVRACPSGHVEDLDWRGFVHGASEPCTRQLWLVERATGGDLADLTVRCDCGKSRSMHEAADRSHGALGTCRGARPWLGNAPWEGCGQPSRLLIRTASNAHFAQVLSALSVPEQATRLEQAIQSVWTLVAQVENEIELAMAKKLLPQLAAALDGLDDGDVVATVAGSGTATPSNRRSSWSSSTRYLPSRRATRTTSRSTPTSTPGGWPTGSGAGRR